MAPGRAGRVVERLQLAEVEVQVQKVLRSGIGGTKVNILVPHTHEHRHLPEIKERIASANLPDPVKIKSLAVFQCLAEAEGEVHGVSRMKFIFMKWVLLMP